MVTGNGNGSYAYRARVCNIASCVPHSITQTTAPPATPAFNAPSYRYLSSGTGRYYLDWTASARATPYEVTGALSYFGPNTIVTLTKTGGVNSVQVRACNENGCSAWSAAFTPPLEGGPNQ